MRALALVCVAAATASATPEAPKPIVDLAAVAPPSDTGRPWPLSELPSLQPHLDLAMAHDACSNAAKQRHAGDGDVLAYLAAWCKIRAGHREAVDDLAPLTRSRRKELARAALLDVVDLIADHEGARGALSHLLRLRLSRADVLDTLAATYRALGDREDAFVAGFEAARLDASPSAATTCERVLAWSALDDRDLLVALDALVGDEPCAKRATATACALRRATNLATGVGGRLVAMRECFVELPDDADRDGKLSVMLVSQAWSEPHDADAWLVLSRVAETAMQISGGEALAIGALENALRVSACGGHFIASVAEAAKRIAAADFHQATLDPRLKPLAAMTVEKCSWKR